MRTGAAPWANARRGGHLVENRAERVQVAPVIDDSAPQLLRSHGRQGACNAEFSGQALSRRMVGQRPQDLRQTEVQHFDVTFESVLRV